jgi:hypothetical protein
MHTEKDQKGRKAKRKGVKPPGRSFPIRGVLASKQSRKGSLSTVLTRTDTNPVATSSSICLKRNHRTASSSLSVLVCLMGRVRPVSPFYWIWCLACRRGLSCVRWLCCFPRPSLTALRVSDFLSPVARGLREKRRRCTGGQ